MNPPFIIPVVSIDQNWQSIFVERDFESNPRGGMLLTDQIGAKNLRLRQSEAGYFADWHVAGDATLIIIQQGVLKITLQNGASKCFKAGDLFIVEDYLPENVIFDSSKHGHQAEVVGEEVLKAVHVKLS